MLEKLTEERRETLEQLKNMDRIWTNWEWLNKNGKQTKRPISKVNDPNTWLTYEQAVNGTQQYGGQYSGIGIMFAQDKYGFAICGIDIDAHHVDTNPLTKEILDMFSDTYIEKSPSGKGYHVLFLAQLDRLPAEQTYKEQFYQKNTNLDVECYISGMTNRYFTFTGNQVSDVDYLIDMTDTLLAFLDKYMRKVSVLPVNSLPAVAVQEDMKFTGGEKKEETAPETTVSAPITPVPTALSTAVLPLPAVNYQAEQEEKKLTGKEEKAETVPTIEEIDIDSRLQVAMRAKNGDLFTALYNGNTSGYNSPSEAVQALMDMLVFYFGVGGQGLVKQVYMRSGLAVGKWAERDTIIDATIANAFQRVSNRYAPPQNRFATPPQNSPQNQQRQKKRKKPSLESYFQFENFIESKGYSIKYNEITHAFDFSGFDKRESKAHLAENVPSILEDELKMVFGNVTQHAVTDYITRYATRHRYNPVLELIESTKWDGVDRINQIYDIFQIPADTEEGAYSRIFIQKWLMQCVCGLFNNDVDDAFSLDIILVFQGKQGIGKTRFFEKLALKSTYFGEGICLDPRDKDSVMQATSKWISELGEIGSTMKKDMDSVKAFLTKATDEYRSPYGKTRLHYPRITSFVGTVNEDEYLIDQTDNRRFVTIPLSPDLVINYETQIKPFDALQLWAQVYELVKDKDKAKCFRLENYEKAHLTKRNASFLKPMKGECEVLDILEKEQTPQQGYICTFKEMTVLDFIELHNLKFDANAVGKVLKKHGYISTKKRVNGTVSRVISLPYKYYNGGGYDSSGYQQNNGGYDKSYYQQNNGGYNNPYNQG